MDAETKARLLEIEARWKKASRERPIHSDIGQHYITDCDVCDRLFEMLDEYDRDQVELRKHAKDDIEYLLATVYSEQETYRQCELLRRQIAEEAKRNRTILENNGMIGPIFKERSDELPM